MQAIEHKELTAATLQAAGLRQYSLEIGSADIALLERFARHIPAGTDVFLNAMAGEQTADRAGICARISALGFVPVPHIAARGLVGEKELEANLQQLMTEGFARDFLVVSGDVQPAGPFEDSVQLVDWIVRKQVPVRRLGVTGYPEGHPERTAGELRQLLERKLQLLAGSGIQAFVALQFSFDAAAIVDWCRDFHGRHPGILVRGGLPGPAKLTTLIRFAQRCGVKSSLARLASMPLSSGLKLVQRVPPVEQLEAIGKYRESVNPNLVAHFFSFGGLEATLDFIGQHAG